MKKLLTFLLSATIVILLFSCKKEQVKVETVAVRDTVYVYDTTLIPSLISDTITTLIVLRHAERDDNGSDPSLNNDGIERADELARLLSNVPVSAIYSTSFNRTKETVQPLASTKGISITEYDVDKSYPELVREITVAHRGKIAIIVGHSNTVPEILKELTDASFNISIDEDQYDNLFIVSLPDNLSPTVMHLKYGVQTP